MYLGLDLGTSAIKALLVKENNAIIGSAEIRFKVSHPQKGWSEQNPQDWEFALKKAVKILKSKYSFEFSLLRGIGISGQMHGATLLDQKGKVLRPCILWNDTRAHLEAKQLDTITKVRKISGNIVFPGFTAPKLIWLANNEPEIFSKIAKVLLPKDYLNFWLTGEYTSDMSDGSGTSWLDTNKRVWSSDLLYCSGMRLNQMPKLFESSEPIGNLRDSLAEEWGLSKNVIVVSGAGDNAAAACGIGVINEGDAFISLGTSGVILVAKENFAPKANHALHTFCHAIHNRWYQMGVILSATDCLNWLANILEKKVEDLTNSLGKRIKKPNSTHFLPYLSGERTPHNDSKIRASFVNLDVSSNQNDLTQSILEGVSFALRDNLEALKNVGTNISTAITIGGGSNSSYWLELIATVLKIDLDIPEKSDFGAAFGAAKLAIIGVTGAKPDDIIKKPRISKKISPKKELIKLYDEAYYKYQSIYPALRLIK